MPSDGAVRARHEDMAHVGEVPPTNIATGDVSAQWPFDIWTGRDASAHATAVPVGTFADDSYMFIYASLNAALKELVRFANVFERTRNCGSRS